MMRIQGRTLITVVMTVFVFKATYSTRAQVIELLNEAQVRTPVLCEITSSVPMTVVALKTSRDGVTYDDTQMRFPRYSGKRLVVPIVGRFAMGNEAFLFREPGRYFLEWTLRLEEPEPGSTSNISVRQTVDVSPTSPATTAFLEKISELEFLHRLFQRDLFEGVPSSARELLTGPAGFDIRALVVIKELIQPLHGVEPLEGRFESDAILLRWADSMLALAKEFPESVYADFAAFSAGGGYVTYLCEARECREMSPEELQKHPLRTKAGESLDLIGVRAGSYLSDSGMCQRARMSIRLSLLDEANELLDSAQRRLPSEVGAENSIENLRGQIRALERRRRHREETRQ